MRQIGEKLQQQWLSTVTAKLIVTIFFLIGGISIFIFVFFPGQLEKNTLKVIGEKAEGVSAATSLAITRSILLDDKDMAEEIIRLSEQVNGVEYLVIHNRDDEVFYALHPAKARLYDYDSSDAYKRITDDNSVLAVRRNITYANSRIGTLFMGFSIAETSALLAQSRKNAAGIGIFFLVLGMFAIILLRNAIYSPLREIKSAVEAFTAGDFSSRLKLDNNDLLGDLATAINDLADKWANAQREWGILNKGLEHRVAERTRELEDEVNERKRAEDELRFYMAKLERSNRELEDFAFVASHDLQEPLRKVQAFGDRLKAACGKDLSEKALNYLDRMQSAAGRMQVLIKDLLTFSRVTSKAQPFVTVDMDGTVMEVLSDLEVTIEKLGAIVEISGLHNIQADPLQMRQLFQNLIGNALKFHKDGVSPMVKIVGEIINGRRLGSKSGQQYCHIVIEDNGIGFDEKYSEKIFAVFQRLHSRSEYDGTGLGLAVCRKIVERHNGTIVAEGFPGQGAKFYITLPVYQNQEKSIQQMSETDNINIDDTCISEAARKQVVERGMETSFMVPCP